MTYYSIFILALGLAMDCLAVSIASGAAIKKIKLEIVLRISFFFGLFQSMMAAIGLAIGQYIKEQVEAYDHWLAFILLSLIGGKMIIEGFKMKDKEESWNPLNWGTLILLSIATSIDALAVGIPLSLINSKVWATILIIGITSFVLSFIGAYTGEKVGHIFEKKIEFLGGAILIFIGIKILLGHLGLI